MQIIDINNLSDSDLWTNGYYQYCPVCYYVKRTLFGAHSLDRFHDNFFGIPLYNINIYEFYKKLFFFF